MLPSQPTPGPDIPVWGMLLFVVIWLVVTTIAVLLTIYRTICQHLESNRDCAIRMSRSNESAELSELITRYLSFRPSP